MRTSRRSLKTVDGALRHFWWLVFLITALGTAAALVAANVRVNHGALFGTGTVIPTEVPRPLVGFVNNRYLWMAFRACVLGVALLLVVLVALAAVGSSLRMSSQRWHRALGATSLAFAVEFALLELTSEYLTFTSVAQEFWMVAGLLGAAVPERAPASPQLEGLRGSTSGGLPPRQLPAG